jgi:formylmethanofuran dehydrogenase subunit B
MTTEAWLAGREAGLDQAITNAAELLRSSRRVVVAGLDTDVAGAEAAIALARRIGGAVDHTHAADALRDLEVMRAAGWIVTTPLQVRARSDVVLLVGLDGDPAGLRLDRPPALHGGVRQTLRVGGADAEMLEVLGTVRARLGGRNVTAVGAAAAKLIETLPQARYGAVIWQAGALGPLTLEMLCGLIDDLNAQTRFCGLPLPPPGNAAGAMQAAAWLTGFPLPLGFAGAEGPAVHDPWRFDARRLVESGEADAVLWVSAGAEAPPWVRVVPTVALTAAGTQFAATPEIAITVGRPGIDHDAVLFDAALGALAARTATAPSSALRVADVLARMTAKLPC